MDWSKTDNQVIARLPAMSFDYTIEEPFERLKEFWKRYTGADSNAKFYDAIAFPHVTPHSVEVHDPSAHPTGILSTSRFVLYVDPSVCNRMGNLHGGAASTIFDLLTTLAILPLSRPGFWEYAGVSRSLSTQYLRPVQVGIKVMVVCEVVSLSKRLAALRGVMRRIDDSGQEVGEVLVSCEHGKVNIDPPKEVTGKL